MTDSLVRSLSRSLTLRKALHDVEAEVIRAIDLHPAGFHSAHEGYAVVLEELDELFEEVKRRERDAPAMRIEAIQVAAMALRFILEVCDGAR